MVGSDFTYGAARRGHGGDAARGGGPRGAQVHVVAPVTVDGVVASSSKVREYILEGRVAAAHRLLGRYFDLDGTVVPGAGRGRGIGFPTANVDTQNELRPAPGVYAVRVRLQDEPPGAWLPGAANIGVKPTFGGTEVTIEAHLLDFSGGSLRARSCGCSSWSGCAPSSASPPWRSCRGRSSGTSRLPAR